MDKIKIARELLRLAKSIIGLLDEIEIFEQKNLTPNRELLIVKDGNKYAVVEHDKRNGQVSYGKNFGKYTDTGIKYVADWTSKPTAIKRFKNMFNN